MSRYHWLRANALTWKLREGRIATITYERVTITLPAGEEPPDAYRRLYAPPHATARGGSSRQI